MGFRIVDDFPLCLPSLRTLQLRHIHWGALDALASAASCPVLETLLVEWDLECHHGAQAFHICSNSLKCLTISTGLCVLARSAAPARSVAFTTLHVRAPSLVHLSFEFAGEIAEYKIISRSNNNDHGGIDFFYPTVGSCPTSDRQNIAMMPIADLLLPNKKFLQLDCSSGHCVRRGELQKLTHLIVRLGPHDEDFPCDLLEHLPNLVSLHVVADSQETCSGWDKSSSGRTSHRAMMIRAPPEDHEIPSCLSSVLKVVEIRGLNGFDDEVQLALAYLLKNGRVLRDLNLYYGMTADPMLLCSSSTIQKNLQNLSSNNCQVTVAALTMII
ncbi:unnamed protein product [Linum tenue]|uniref:FBD domain-containing protein n=1 Tax=Linum tenue TaxID=586396 RepID=A0AAV0KKE6_9ROSI|nr:unnamed protein product [Linum tenue]